MNTTTNILTANTVSAPAAHVPAEPSILTANTYFWKPGCSADNRRRNEARNAATVAAHLTALGFAVETGSGFANGTLQTAKGEIAVRFSYSESCANVYKSLTVTRAGKNSNITTLRKIAAAL